MPLHLFNPGKLDDDERLGMTIMEEKISDEDARYNKSQRRVGLCILNRFPWTEAEELFEILDLPTTEMARWKDALERAQAMPEPEPVIEHPPEKIYVGNSRPGELNGMATVTDNLVRAIRRDFDTHNYTTLTQLGQKYGVSRQTATRIGRRQGWAHVREAKKKQV